LSRFALSLVAAALLSANPAHAELFAERITRENWDTRRIGGVDAIAGLGDWALGNGTLCASVSDRTHQSGMSTQGGALIDLGHCDRADDQLAVAQAMLGLGRNNIAGVDRIRAERDGREAAIVTEVTQSGVYLERRYALSLDRPHVLQLTTRARRVESGDRVGAIGEMILHPSGSMAVFSRGLRFAAGTRGFRYPEMNSESLRKIVASFTPADLHVMVGDEAIEPGIAYGWYLREAHLERAGGKRQELPFLANTSEDHSLLAVFARPYWIGGRGASGLLSFAQTTLMDLRLGETLSIERDIIVGERNDVASVSDHLHAEAPVVRGRASDPGTRLHVNDADGRAFTQVRPDEDGLFAFRAPRGGYVLRALAQGGRLRERGFTVESSDIDLGILDVGRAARVALPAGHAMRLVFKGTKGTPDPRIGDELLERFFGAEEARAGRRSNDVSLAGLPDDPSEVVLAPGSYVVYATRGPEFDVTQANLELRAGERKQLAIAVPPRAIQTPGWIAADLHVHAAPSFDSAYPVDQRLRSFAAQGGEVLVSTEHNRIHDPGPLLERLGLERRLSIIVGSEVTSTGRSKAAPFTFGHANVFPLPHEPTAFRGGALAFNGRRLREAIADARRLPGERLFQLNHPRSASGQMSDGAFLGHLSLGSGFDPSQPLDAPDNRALLERDPISGLRDLDWDAVELINGPSLLRYEATRADWVSLWMQGEPRTGTANSDSHRADEIVALPRTYVRLPDDRIEAFDADRFVRALRRGHAVGTTGPFVELRLGDAGPGDTFAGRDGELLVEVRSAAWVPVSTLRVWQGDQVIDERPIRSGDRVRLPLHFDGDTFVWAEVTGVPDLTYAAIAPGFTPLAFTNPIRVEVQVAGPGAAAATPAPEL
jgi:hypothetical protein